MKMKFAILGVLALAAVACTWEKEEADYSTNANAIHISPFIMTSFTKTNVTGTAAEQTTFEEGDQITLSCEDGSMTFEKKGSDWVPTDKCFLVWYEDGQYPAYHAYSPVGGTTTELNFTVPSSQNTVAKMKKADYMVADIDTPLRGSGNKLMLPMQRKMAMVRITIKTTATSVKLSGFKVASYAGYSGGAVRTDYTQVSPCPVAPDGGSVGSNGTVYMALVAPGPADASSKFVSYSNGGSPVAIMGVPAMDAGLVYDYVLDLEAHTLR